MDKMMTSKDSTAAAGASAYDHHNQHEAAAMGAVVEEARNQARQQVVANGGRDRKPRPQLEEALRCPRCDSGDTKFCYYNNYSLLQPRYFCKGCRRYWTHGGSLRNVPVGGGCRKNKRSLLPPAGSSSIKKEEEEQQHLVMPASSMTEHDFPNVLPTFMSTGFELPGSQLPFSPPPLSLFGLAPAQPLAPTGAGTPSFLEMLRGGFLDYHQSNGFYEPASSGMEAPPLVFGAVMQHRVAGDCGGGAPIGGEGVTAAATHQGVHQRQTALVVARQEGGAGEPDKKAMD